MKDFRGFTLIELLVVIAIIGVLATLILLQLGVARAKARDTKRIADINQIRTAVELYYDDNGGQYPTTIYPSSGTGILKYMSAGVAPVDPLTGNDYGYSIDDATTPRKYQVWSELENNSSALKGDSDINSSALSWSGNTVDGSTETCDAYVAGTSTQCVFDVGQN